MKRNTARQGVAAGFAYGMPDFPVSPARAARCGSIAAGEQAGDFLMIDKPIEKIEFSDLEKLLENSVAESRTIEYKRELPGGTGSDKKEFLADVSAFANTLGGDLLYGISEKGGVPVAIGGVKIADADAEKQKYESMIADGIEPKIRVDLRTIAVAEGKVALLIRVAKSSLSPHRVIFGGHDKFYARNSSGKYSLDTQQLRDAFNHSQTVGEKMKEFVTDRIFKVSAGHITSEMKWPGGARAILHFIPMVSFNSEFTVNLKAVKANSAGILDVSWFNFEGIAGDGLTRMHSHVQVFRNGIVEYIGAIDPLPEEKLFYTSAVLQTLRVFFCQSLRLLKNNGIHPPYFVCLNFVGVQGYMRHIPSAFPRSLMGELPSNMPKLDRDVLQIPARLVESYDIKPADVLLPMYDILYNAFGVSEAPAHEKELL